MKLKKLLKRGLKNNMTNKLVAKNKPTAFLTAYVVKNGKKEFICKNKHNERVDAGADALYALLTSGGTNAPKYVALASSAQTITKTMTSLTDEISGNGLSRVEGTISGYTAPTALDGVASYHIQNTFVFTGTSANVYSVAIFDDDTAGNLYYVWNLPTPKPLTQTDQFVVDITVQF